MNEAPSGEFSLTGPSVRLDSAHWPARGDLAHIRLAGNVFVPNYAVPLPYVVDLPATLLTAPRDDALVREDVPQGVPFNVLDIAGKWAWGQIGEDGCVGYLPMAALRRG